ncbi:MAG TPA: hypothetical protein VL463_29965 [Kofleriaceae bacterium]|jgi:hypothetical protein|nr:hypothetical protein [Kofleriaceae bacterium]
MKKKTLPKLRLDKQSLRVLSHDEIRDAAGAMPDPFPPSWFRCGFTIWCD